MCFLWTLRILHVENSHWSGLFCNTCTDDTGRNNGGKKNDASTEVPTTVRAAPTTTTRGGEKNDAGAHHG